MRTRRGIAAVTVCVSLLAPLTAPASPAVSAAKSSRPHVQPVKMLPHHLLRLGKAHLATPASRSTSRPASWPRAATAEVILGSAGVAKPVEAKVGDMSVAVAGGHSSSQDAVGLEVVDQSIAHRANLSGVILAVRRQSHSNEDLVLSIDYRSFADASGGQFGNRLRLVSLPACVLSTPEVAACQQVTPVAYRNNWAGGTLTANLSTAAAPTGASARPADATLASVAGSMVVLAATSSTSGSNGTYTATSLSPSGKWSSSGASGSFDWSYPITVPPVAAGSGVAPSVSLSYDSGSVDGRTSSTNDQSSWVGEGWDYSPGYIERSYSTCSDISTLPAGDKTGDECWSGPETSQSVTLSLGGSSESLVYNSANQSWHAAHDDASQVQMVGTGANEHWEVTNASGVHYFFGLDNLPGGTTATNATWTMPVYGPVAGEPCYNPTFGAAVCPQVWRWNLDFVVDPNGNATTYSYTPEWNYYTPQYSAGGGTNTTPVVYQRGGYLNEIDYGLRDESAGTDPADPLSGTITTTSPTGRVVFSVADRVCSSCTSTWPDTPQDLDCSAGSGSPPPSTPTCKFNSPSFWSRKMLTQITTSFWDTNLSPAGFQTADVYRLNQSFTTEGDPSVQLDSIVRTAYATGGGASIVSPAVTFAYQLMDNRVYGWNQSLVTAMDHHRLTTVTTETGSTLEIYYSCASTASMSPANCTSEENPAAPGTQAAPLCTVQNPAPPGYVTVPSSPPARGGYECYPVYWNDQGTAELDWFNKYVVTEVQTFDPTMNDPTQITAYNYLGIPTWHYDNQPTLPANLRTWGEWRGYPQVQTRTGNPTYTSANGTADKWTLETSRYFLGMDGDGPAGSTTSASVTDSLNNTYTDSNQYAGRTLETQTFNYDGGPQLSATITAPETVATTADETEAGLPDLTSNVIGTATSTAYTNLAAGGTRQTKTAYTYNPQGLVTKQVDTGTSVATLCTTTSYAQNTTAPTYIVAPVAETIQYAQSCSTGRVLSDVRHYYDNSTTLNYVGTQGIPTEVDTATTTSPSLYFSRTTTQYDLSGRPTSTTAFVNATDKTGRTTTTAYTPADGGPLTQESTTSPADAQGTKLTSSKTIDPSRGVTTVSTNPAGQVTTVTYDPLGRLTAVWEPGQVVGSTAPTTSYSYQYGPGAPLAITTTKLVDCGPASMPCQNTTSNFAYRTSVQLFDSLGQLRQTQTDGVYQATQSNLQGTPSGTVVADTFHDSHGWVVATNNHWYTSGSPSPSNIDVTAGCYLTDRTQNLYDGAGRATETDEYNNAQNGCNGQTPPPTWSTYHIYSGTSTTTIPPQGGVETTDVTDARGNTTLEQQWTSPPTITNGVITGGSADNTSYSYDPLNRRTQMTTAAGTAQAGTWTWTYDLAGRTTQKTDPDTGTTTSNYDDVGELTSTTDANGKTLAYHYDRLGRKTGEFVNTTSGTKLAGWTYDTLQAGKLTSSTRYTGQGNYTVSATGYDNAGNPTGTTTTVPSSLTGFASSYTTNYTWTTTNQMASETPPTAGYLDPETINFWYNSFGDPYGETAGVAIISDATYTVYNQPAQYTLGVNSQTSWLTYNYDPQTLRTTGTQLSSQTAPPQLEATTYTYDPAGNITSSTDTQGDPAANAPVETSCYTYDSLDELTQAWSSSTAGNCSNNPTNNGPAAVGGPQPNWETWQYDAAANRSSQTQHNLTGGADTVTTYTTGTAGPAHATAATNTTGPNSSATSYSYDADGNLRTANLPTGTNTYNWDSESHATSIATPAGTATYIHDADGNQLVRQDTTPTTNTTTLYLPGEELTRDNNTGRIGGTRYYTFNGSTVAVAVAIGTPYYLYFLYNNLQNTDQTAIPTNSYGTLPPIRRFSDPYGNPYSATTGGAWPDTHAFLNKPADPLTALDDIGARQYDPTTGRFIQPDAILDPTKPQQANGYTYANNNPTTLSDPTGNDSGFPWVPMPIPTTDNGGGTATSSGGTTNTTTSAGSGSGTTDVQQHGSIGKAPSAKQIQEAIDAYEYLAGPHLTFGEPGGQPIYSDGCGDGFWDMACVLGTMAGVGSCFHGVSWGCAGEIGLWAVPLGLGKIAEGARVGLALKGAEGAGAGAAGAETGGGILANQAAGNAARDAIAAANPGSEIEQTFSTALGARRIDVLTQDGLAIESKVGRTSLTSDIQSQIAKDQWLMGNNPDVTGVQWVFGRSAVTGQIGPTGPLAAALDKAGIPWTLGP